jgi:hypothetical protein
MPLLLQVSVLGPGEVGAVLLAVSSVYWHILSQTLYPVLVAKNAIVLAKLSPVKDGLPNDSFEGTV